MISPNGLDPKPALGRKPMKAERKRPSTDANFGLARPSADREQHGSDPIPIGRVRGPQQLLPSN